jgi:pimeloyl-ACP methyl ester carboxylesterase
VEETGSVKKLIRPLAAGAGLTGALAALNRRLRRREPPTNALGGTPRPWRWRDYDIFATEAGTGPLVILVHGIYAGASSYEFRYLFPLLARTHRVVAFDLLGCGLSARPNLAYSAELFTEQIVDALNEFGAEPTTLIGSSLGGAFAIRAAARANDRVKHLVAVCPTGLGGVLDRPASGAQRAVAATFRSPLLGEALFNLLASRPSLRWFLENQSYADKASATPEVVDHYYAVTHLEGARYVPATFVGGLLNCDVARDLPFVEAPTLICWGERAPSVSPLSGAGEFLKLAQNAKLATFANSGLLPHEEEPDAAYAAIESFIAPLALAEHDPA